MKILISLICLAALSAVPTPLLAQLDTNESDTLQWMREEEKLARDAYIALHDTWGLNVFANISRSEQRHMDAMLSELIRFGLPDPVTDDTAGAFNDPVLGDLYDELVSRGNVSLLEALHVGAYIEEIDIADLWRALDETDEPSLINAYENILAGSNNHLRAFVSQIGSRGVAYEAQFLSQEEVDAIVGGYDLPDSDFEINAGLNDSWYYPETDGQGFFLTVYPDSKTLFLAWFTFDTALPDEAASADLGWADQRWLTAQGSYDGGIADLQAYVTSGGVFDAEDPVPTSEPWGSIQLQFDSCTNGTVSYDFPSVGRNGLVPIQRIAPDNVSHCENLANKSITD